MVKNAIGKKCIESITMRKFILAMILLLIGCIQMIGDIFNIPLLIGVGRALNASPAPKVFTTQNGYETFSARFYIQYVDFNGKQQTVEITPENYQHLKGPYNRRNMYGATISYAPVLYLNSMTRPMFEQIIIYSTQDNAPLIKELNIEANLSNPVVLTIEHREKSSFTETKNYQFSIIKGEVYVKWLDV
jgi:hypothetical protein